MTFKQWLRKAFGPRVQGSRASRRGKSRQPSRRRCVPRLEFLEDRLVPAILMVTSLASHWSPACRQWCGNICAPRSRTASTTPAVRHRQRHHPVLPPLDGGTINLSTSVTLDVAGPSAFLIGNSDTLVIDGQTGLTQGITINRRSGATPFRLFDVATGGNLTLKA